MVADNGSTSATQGLPTADGSVRRATAIDADVRDVWAALTEPGALAAWFGAAAEIDVRPRGSLRFRWPDGSERRGVIVAIDPPNRLVFRWRGVRGTTSADASVVAFDLEPSPGGTILTVTETLGVIGTEADRAPLLGASR